MKNDPPSLLLSFPLSAEIERKSPGLLELRAGMDPAPGSAFEACAAEGWAAVPAAADVALAEVLHRVQAWVPPRLSAYRTRSHRSESQDFRICFRLECPHSFDLVSYRGRATTYTTLKSFVDTAKNGS